MSEKVVVRLVGSRSRAGEHEFTFWHVLTRDVAYAALPRVARAARHVAAARWIEARAGDRVEDVADVLAHHYTTALDLSQAASPEDAAGLEAPTLRFLSLAGERALNLDADRAVGLLERALSLTPPGHPDRRATLVLLARAAELTGRYADSAKALEEAVNLAREQGDVIAQAQAMLQLTFTWIELGDPRARALPDELIRLLEPLGPSPELAEAYGRAAGWATIDIDYAQAIALLDRAVAVADVAHFKRDTDSLSFRSMALGFRAYARSTIGERAALDDFREAIRMALEAGNGNRVTILYNNMAGPLASFEGPTAATQLLREALDFASARGLRGATGYLKLELLLRLMENGELDQSTALIDELRPEFEAGGSVRDLAWLRYVEARLIALRGLGSDVPGDLPTLAEVVQVGTDTEMLVAGLTAVAVAQAVAGNEALTVEALDELISLGVVGRRDSPDLLLLERAAIGVGRPDYIQRLTEAYDNASPYGEHVRVHSAAILAEALGDLETAAVGYADAADRWSQFGVVTECAFARLGRGRCLMAIGEVDEATVTLAAARETFAALRASQALVEIEALTHVRGSAVP
jgi:tetratricopeptide (TPR) repeat protein